MQSRNISTTAEQIPFFPPQIALDQGCLQLANFLEELIQGGQSQELPRLVRQLLQKFSGGFEGRRKQMGSRWSRLLKITKSPDLGIPYVARICSKFINEIRQFAASPPSIMARKTDRSMVKIQKKAESPKSRKSKQEIKLDIGLRYWNELEARKKENTSEAQRLILKLRTLEQGFLTLSHKQIQQQKYVFTHYLNNCLGCQRKLQQINCRTGQAYYIINDLTSQIQLGEKACILLNSGGGYLLSGNKKAGLQEILKKYIYPQQFYTFEEVNIENNENPTEVIMAGHKTILCPVEVGRVFYLNATQDNNASKKKYRCLTMDTDKLKQMEDANLGHLRHSQVFQSQVYDLMHKKHREKQKLCKKLFDGYPIKLPTKTCNRACVKPLSKQKYDFVLKSQNKILKEHRIHEEPYTAYGKQLMMRMATSKDHNTVIRQIQDNLQEKKKTEVEISKPFKGYTPMGTCSMWFISHNYKADEIAPIIKQALPEGQFDFDSCTKYMRLSKEGPKELADIKANLQKNGIKFILEKNIFKFQKYQESAKAFVVARMLTFCHSSGEPLHAGKK